MAMGEVPPLEETSDLICRGEPCERRRVSLDRNCREEGCRGSDCRVGEAAIPAGFCRRSGFGRIAPAGWRSYGKAEGRALVM